MTRRRAESRLVWLGVGLVAAGVGAAVGVAAERVAVRLPLRSADRGQGAEQGQEEDLEPFGELRGVGVEVTADDGTRLHVEVDEVDREGEVDQEGEVDHESEVDEEGEVDQDGVTVVFSHGFALCLDSWHFQRQALRGRYRLVFWDHRGHGRSATGPPGSATIDQVGADLGAVLDAVAPHGPLVLIGHSMGGMAVMALAEQRPQLFADRVRGVALVATSASELGSVDFGVARVGRVLHRLAPLAVRTLARAPRLVEHGRRLGADLEAVLVRHYSFGSPVSPQLVRFVGTMIAETRLEVLSDFMPTFSEHDKRVALSVLEGREVLVIAGEDDLMIPFGHGARIAQALPGAELVVVPDAGHLLMLEHPQQVTRHLEELIERSIRSALQPPAGTRASRAG